MKYVVLPLICLLTLGTFPLFLYWYTDLYVYCLFDIVSIGSFEEMVAKVMKQKKLIEEELEKQRNDLQLLEGNGYFEEEDYLVTIKVSSNKLNLEKEKDVFEASITHLLVEDGTGEPHVASIDIQYDVENRDELNVYFTYHFIKSKLNFHTAKFEPVVFNCIHDPEYLKSKYGKGIQTELEVKEKQKLFGQCLIEVPKRPMYTLLLNECLTPFHLF